MCLRLALFYDVNMCNVQYNERRVGVCINSNIIIIVMSMADKKDWAFFFRVDFNDAETNVSSRIWLVLQSARYQSAGAGFSDTWRALETTINLFITDNLYFFRKIIIRLSIGFLTLCCTICILVDLILLNKILTDFLIDREDYFEGLRKNWKGLLKDMKHLSEKKQRKLWWCR